MISTIFSPVAQRIKVSIVLYIKKNAQIRQFTTGWARRQRFYDVVQVANKQDMLCHQTHREFPRYRGQKRPNGKESIMERQPKWFLVVHGIS
jgi:hypothetical protein